MPTASQAARHESILCETKEKRPLLSAVWDYLRQLFALAVFFGVAVAVNLLAGLLSACRIAPRKPGLWRSAIARLFSLWIILGRTARIVRVHFPEHDKLKDLRGTIVAANHPSLVDAFALLVVVPRAVCIMRSDLAANPALSHLSRLAGYISNDRGPSLVREGVAHLSRGENLLIFPEGTRTDPGPLNPFKKGFALIATRAGSKVQTIHIRLKGTYFSKKSGLLSPSRLPVDLTLELGKTFQPHTGETPGAFAERLESYFREEAAREYTAGRADVGGY